MKLNGSNMYINLSGLRFWLVLFALCWLLGSLGLGWILKSLFILIGILLLLPVLAFIGVRLWIQNNIVNGNCPVCGQGLTGIKNQTTQCSSCGTPLTVTQETFQRPTSPGTVDISADVIDISGTELPD